MQFNKPKLSILDAMMLNRHQRRKIGKINGIRIKGVQKPVVRSK